VLELGEPRRRLPDRGREVPELARARARDLVHQQTVLAFAQMRELRRHLLTQDHADERTL
jgi:hypothetical protein